MATHHTHHSLRFLPYVAGALGLLIGLLLLYLLPGWAYQLSSAPKGAVIKTNLGDVTIKFRRDTPQTVDNFARLARSGFYTDTRIHRIVPNFLIQGGDPLSKNPALKSVWGKGGPGYTFADEIRASLTMSRGSVAMANSGPDTQGSQFFIVVSDEAQWLTGQNTIFAEVISGIEIADTISTVPVSVIGIPVREIVIKEIMIF